MIKAPPLVTTCVGLGVKLTNRFMTLKPLHCGTDDNVLLHWER